jgi:hypothetical protein
MDAVDKIFTVSLSPSYAFHRTSANGHECKKQCLWVLLVLLRLVTSVAPGKYRFAPGLYLQVGVPEAKSWIYRFTLRDKERFMGLGSARDVTLTQARKRMEEIGINLVSKKIDPMAEREKAL